MGDLVVGDGEGFTVSVVEGFASEFVFDGEPAFFAEEAIQMEWLVDRGDAVFGKQHDADAARFVEVD